MGINNLCLLGIGKFNIIHFPCNCIILVLTKVQYHLVAQNLFKFAYAQQAQVIYTFKNIKEKLMKANVAIWFDKIGKSHQHTTKHIQIEGEAVFVVCLLNYVTKLSNATCQDPYTQAWGFYA